MTPADTAAITPDDWARRMLASPGRSGLLALDGRKLHYLEWGEPTNPRVILLLHGFLGHAHWWDFVAPWLAGEYRVLAMDFAGMGDSSAAASYSNARFVADVGAMLRMISIPVVLIGHSFGGRVAGFVMREFPHCVHHGIIVDSNIAFSDRSDRPRLQPHSKKTYPTLDAACARFRFFPEEPPAAPLIMRHLAEHSVKAQAGGYVWKFDENVLGSVQQVTVTVEELMGGMEMPVDFIAGELSLVVPPGVAQRTGKALRHGRGPIVIPSAHHHIPVNQPLALTAALRALLSH